MRAHPGLHPIDIDALDPAFAPGVASREPGGLSPRQVIDWLHAIDQPIVAATDRENCILRSIPLAARCS
jgi:hypothetical protein